VVLFPEAIVPCEPRLRPAEAPNHVSDRKWAGTGAGWRSRDARWHVAFPNWGTIHGEPAFLPRNMPVVALAPAKHGAHASPLSTPWERLDGPPPPFASRCSHPGRSFWQEGSRVWARSNPRARASVTHVHSAAWPMRTPEGP
jgi:hypothetical protein